MELLGDAVVVAGGADAHEHRLLRRHHREHVAAGAAGLDNVCLQRVVGGVVHEPAEAEAAGVPAVGAGDLVEGAGAQDFAVCGEAAIEHELSEHGEVVDGDARAVAGDGAGPVYRR